MASSSAPDERSAQRVGAPGHRRGDRAGGRRWPRSRAGQIGRDPETAAARSATPWGTSPLSAGLHPTRSLRRTGACSSRQASDDELSPGATIRDARNMSVSGRGPADDKTIFSPKTLDIAAIACSRIVISGTVDGTATRRVDGTWGRRVTTVDGNAFCPFLHFGDRVPLQRSSSRPSCSGPDATSLVERLPMSTEPNDVRSLTPLSSVTSVAVIDHGEGRLTSGHCRGQAGVPGEAPRHHDRRRTPAKRTAAGEYPQERPSR